MQICCYLPSIEMAGLRRGGLPAALVAGLLLVGCLSNLGSGNVVFEVKHKFGGTAGSVSGLGARKAHDGLRHGRLLAAVDLPLGGNGSPTDIALYYTEIGIGNPSKDYYVQVDTGSDLMWVNCIGCENCPKKSDIGVDLTLYDPRSSSTGAVVTCDQDFCSELSNPSDCTAGAVCAYGISYGDGSSSVGYFVNDNIQLDRASGNLQTTPMNGSITFGCGVKQSGLLSTSTQAVDGLLGFGQAKYSMISQLALNRKVKRMFSHCLEGNDGGGIFAIGQLVQPKLLNTTSIIPNQTHYNILLKTIEVGGAALQLPKDVLDPDSGKKVIIDTGTTLAYLEEQLYNPLIQKIIAAQPGLKLQTVEQQFTCFQFNGDVDQGFPAVTFQFNSSLSLVVYPHEYLFQIHGGMWCFGWQKSGNEMKDGSLLNLLGDMVLSDKLVLYDLENQSIGWTAYNCSSSIKVKDEQSGAEYEVGYHELSSAHSLNMGWALTISLLLAFLHGYLC